MTRKYSGRPIVRVALSDFPRRLCVITAEALLPLTVAGATVSSFNSTKFLRLAKLALQNFYNGDTRISPRSDEQ